MIIGCIGHLMDIFYQIFWIDCFKLMLDNHMMMLIISKVMISYPKLLLICNVFFSEHVYPTLKIMNIYYIY